MYQEAAIRRKEGFQIFSSIPVIAQRRKKDVLSYMKDINKEDENLKFQIRSGIDDLKLMIKYQPRGKYCHWRHVPIKLIDPFGMFEDFDLETSDENNPVEQNPGTTVELPWESTGAKRKNRSPAKVNAKRTHTDRYPNAEMAQRLKSFLDGPANSILELS